MSRRTALVPAAVIAVVLVVSLAGPLLAPYSPTATSAAPYEAPSAAHLLGTDHLGRDVVSRVLHGGLPVLATSVTAAAAATVLGVTAGLVAALAGIRHRALEAAVLRPLDAVAAVPPVLALVLVLTALPSRTGVVVAVAVAGVPLSARVVYAAARPVVHRPHVELAMARGERLPWLLGREILPLVAAPVLADAGIRVVLALYLVTAAGFLGIGLGGTDWGTLIVEAIPGAMLQPVALVAPLLLVAALAVSVNRVSDAVVHRSRAVLG